MKKIKKKGWKNLCENFWIIFNEPLDTDNLEINRQLHVFIIKMREKSYNNV